jgi:indole-3-glycerol phosphate synthase
MILEKIVKRKKEEVAILRKKGIGLPKQFRDKHIDRPRGFRQSLLSYQGVSVIAEIKKASPSKGIICKDFDPVLIAQNYQNNGAQALSVLTDVDFFMGSLVYLMQAREVTNLPVLRKDFIIDPVQIDEASIHGADAILLIAAILDINQMKDLQSQASQLGIDCLVEVHNESELENALSSGAELIGLNNRNLNDFSVDINTTFRLKQLTPTDIPVVSESGIKNAAELQKLEEHGITAALIGESLMRAGGKSSMLKSLREPNG